MHPAGLGARAGAYGAGEIRVMLYDSYDMGLPLRAKTFPQWHRAMRFAGIQFLLSK